MSDDPVYDHSPYVRRILWVLAPIACPPEIIEQDLMEPVIDDLAAFMCNMPPFIRVATVAGLRIFDSASALHPAHGGKNFVDLDGERAHRWFDLWWHSDVALMREFAKKTKGLIAFCYYERPEVMAALAYHPDRWIAAVAKRRIDKWGEEIRKKDAEVRASDPLTDEMVSSTGAAEVM